MTPSDEAYTLIKRFEGCKLSAYPDPATGGDPWTIGFGHTGPDVKRGVTWTQAQANAALEHDVDEKAEQVFAVLKGAFTTQHEFDALVSFAYNVGIRNLKDSTLLRMHQDGDKKDAAKQFVRWNRANGKVMKGLTTRREAEARVYQGLTP